MLRSELKLVFARRRNIALLILLALVPAAVALAVYLSGRGPEGGEGPAFLSQVTSNGVFAALAGLAIVLPFLLPLTVAIVSGDSIAGEANLGTLRYLLARPVPRTRLLTAKFVVLVVFCLAAAAAVWLGGLIAGAILFPLGRVTTLSGVTLPFAEGVGRALVAAAIVGSSMIGLAAVGTFASSLTEAPMGAMAATAGTAIVVQVLDSIPQLRSIHPVLFSDKWLAFGDIMRVPAGFSGVERDLLLQLCWAVVFFSAAWARLTTRDVLA